MIILDTDHWSALKYRDNEGGRLLQTRINASTDQDFVVTAITLEEQMRGWLADIHSTQDTLKQVTGYQRLVNLVRYFSVWKILSFDVLAAQRTLALRKAKIRIGTMDLKIAAMALSKDALLLTANARDFAQVPGLRFENWLH